MADIAASVLARLKIRLLNAVRAISSACSSFARKNSFADWGNPNMLKTLC